jgi:hypothetical protein
MEMDTPTDENSSRVEARWRPTWLREAEGMSGIGERPGERRLERWRGEASHTRGGVYPFVELVDDTIHARSVLLSRQENAETLLDGKTDFWIFLRWRVYW